MNHKELIQKGLWVMVVQSLGAGLLLFLHVFFARELGVENFGIFSLSLTLFTMLSILSRAGLDVVVLKQFAANIQSAKDVALGYVLSAFSLIIVIGLALTFFVNICAGFCNRDLFDSEILRHVLAVFAIGFAPVSIVMLAVEVLKAFNRPVISSFLRVVLIPLFAILIAMSYTYQHSVNQLDFFVFSYVAALIITSIVSFLVIVKILPKVKPTIIQWGVLLKEGFPMLLVTSGALVMSWTDVVVLGIFMEPENVGIYSAASKVVMATNLILIAVNSIVAPKYARYYKEGRLENIAELSKKASSILIISVFIPTCIFLFQPSWVLSVFGQEFSKGGLVLIVLSIGQFFNVAGGSVGYLLSMTGNERSLRMIFGITALLNIVLSVILVGSYQELGVAISTALSVITWNAWGMYLIKKKFGFWTMSFR